MVLVSVCVPLFLPSATNKRRCPSKFWKYYISVNYILAHPNLMGMPNSLKMLPCFLSFRHQNYSVIINEYEEEHLKRIFNVFLLRIESKPWFSELYEGQTVWGMRVRQLGKEILYVINFQLQTLHTGIGDEWATGSRCVR